MDRLVALWGKSGAEGTPHPLVLHMLDSGMVARALLQAPQWRRIRSLLVRLADLDAMRVDSTLPFLVSLHDIGKAAPGFQRLVDGLWEAVRNEGLSDAHPFWRGVRFRHDIESYAVLGDVVLPEWVAPVLDEPTPLRRRRVMWGLAQALGGHHGAFVSGGELKPYGEYPQVAAGSDVGADVGWNEARMLLVHALAHEFGVKPQVRVAAGHLSAFCTALNGFVILCDWIASNEDYFPPVGMTSPEAYANLSWERAQVAVETAGLLRYPESSDPPTFAALFPKYEPRPLQAALDSGELKEITGSVLAVIEAPTGEGKTEAALLLAHRLAGSTGGGLYFALPTAATSEQLFRRVEKFFAASHTGTGAAGLALVHGQADLSPDVQRLSSADESDHGDATVTAPVVIDSWLLPRKRALLAPFAVGTVDQAMLAALRVRHGSLRLLGLAGKVVIIDEVHAYDAYMSVIIERLLEWLAELGVSVILLSATLPAATRQRLLGAYGVVQEQVDDTTAYPLITLGYPGGKTTRMEPAASNAERSVQIEQHEACELPATLSQAVSAAARGAAVGWVCDTVGAAQAAFKEARAALDELEPSVRPQLILYHARMLAGRRREIETRVESLVGKRAERETGSIIVATQVVEQSLDIDFDLLVTELAPIDLLLQRIGRLHRHDRVRPEHVASPVCRVLLPEQLGGSKLQPPEWVYEPFILMKTRVALLGRACVSVPADVRSLVEAVYDGLTPDQEDLASIGVSPEAAMEARMSLRTTRQTAEGAARLHLLGAPDRHRFTEGERGVPLLDDLTDEDVLEGESELGAQTRLAAPSARVVLVDGGIEQLREGAVLTRAERVPHDLCRWLLDRSVSVSHPGLLKHVASAPGQPASFEKTPALRNHVLLRTSGGAYRWEAGGRSFRLLDDEELGMVIEEVEGG